jgi:uncharacterized protein YkwD
MIISPSFICYLLYHDRIFIVQFIITYPKNGIKYKNVGENIAMQQGAETISSYDMAKKFMDMWMNSSGHRANILSSDYTNLGVGVAKSGTLVEATQVFFTPM